MPHVVGSDAEDDLHAQLVRLGDEASHRVVGQPVLQVQVPRWNAPGGEGELRIDGEPVRAGVVTACVVDRIEPIPQVDAVGHLDPDAVDPLPGEFGQAVVAGQIAEHVVDGRDVGAVGTGVGRRGRNPQPDGQGLAGPEVHPRGAGAYLRSAEYDALDHGLLPTTVISAIAVSFGERLTGSTTVPAA